MDNQESTTIWKGKLICGIYDRMCGHVFVERFSKSITISLGKYIQALSFFFVVVVVL